MSTLAELLSSYYFYFTCYYIVDNYLFSLLEERNLFDNVENPCKNKMIRNMATEMLNTGLPAGLRVRECYAVERPARELAYLRTGVELDYDRGVPDGAMEQLRELFAREEVLVEKRTKHKELAEINVIPLIRSLDITEGENLLRIETVVCAQNPGLNPALLAQAVERSMPELTPDFARVRRLELYDAQMQIFR